MRQWLRKLMTLNGSPWGIAGGFSLGLSLSLVPIPFAGMFLALAIAPLLRCNLPATYLGTAVVNPLTGPLIYFAELWLGLAVLGQQLPSWATMQQLDGLGWWHVFRDAAGPFGLGALLCSAAGFVLTFPLLWWLSSRWQQHGPPEPEPTSPDEP